MTFSLYPNDKDFFKHQRFGAFLATPRLGTLKAADPSLVTQYEAAKKNIDPTDIHRIRLVGSAAMEKMATSCCAFLINLIYLNEVEETLTPRHYAFTCSMQDEAIKATVKAGIVLAALADRIDDAHTRIDAIVQKNKDHTASKAEEDEANTLDLHLPYLNRRLKEICEAFSEATSDLCQGDACLKDLGLHPARDIEASTDPALNGSRLRRMPLLPEKIIQHRIEAWGTFTKTLRENRVAIGAHIRRNKMHAQMLKQ